MKDRMKLAVIGGFLGSGKTTAILDIAKKLMGSGIKVGIVTNDQGSNLVDTNFLRSAGFPVLEVDGGCFCCNFDEFVRKLNTLARENLPDIILAEPVGSCTDLVASIFKPMQMKQAGEFALAPLCVLADPRRAKRLMDDSDQRFQSEINYLFKKQLEEADIILLNKIDLFAPDEIKTIKNYLQNTFEGAEVLCVSAKEGKGIEKILPVLLGFEAQSNKVLMELDYDAYGLAESFLGWFNATAAVVSERAVDLKAFIADFMNDVKEKTAKMGKDIAHLKTYAMGTGGYTKASITGVDDAIDFYEDNFKSGTSFSMVVNARMNVPPIQLEEMMKAAIEYSAQKFDVKIERYKSDCFTPGMPSRAARDGQACSCCCSCKKE